jgi:hypothetical protein
MVRVSGHGAFPRSGGFRPHAVTAAVLFAVILGAADVWPCCTTPDWQVLEGVEGRSCACTIDSANVAGLRMATRADASSAMPPVRTGSGDTTWERPLAPRVSGALPSVLRLRLHNGFALATRQVDEVPACRALLAALDPDAETKLATTLYYGAPQQSPCTHTMAAFTVVRSPATWLCPTFERLMADEAAVILIHEALHHAGLRERPPTPDAMTSEQINAMVRASCQRSPFSIALAAGKPWDSKNRIVSGNVIQSQFTQSRPTRPQ